MAYRDGGGQGIRRFKNTRRRPLLERLDEKILVLIDVPCWFWIGSIGTKGYGEIGNHDDPKRSRLAHRLIYEHYVGPIPDKLEPDHLCRNTQCVFYGHLEPVSHKENIRRGFAGITYCPQGHEYSPENTNWRKHKDREDHRECRQCKRTSDANSRDKRRRLAGKEKYRSKVTADIAEIIRVKSAAGQTQTSLAREFGISQTAVWAIIRRKLWAAKI